MKLIFAVIVLFFYSGTIFAQTDTGLADRDVREYLKLPDNIPVNKALLLFTLANRSQRFDCQRTLFDKLPIDFNRVRFTVEEFDGVCENLSSLLSRIKEDPNALNSKIKQEVVLSVRNADFEIQEIQIARSALLAR